MKKIGKKGLENSLESLYFQGDHENFFRYCEIIYRSLRSANWFSGLPCGIGKENGPIFSCVFWDGWCILTLTGRLQT